MRRALVLCLALAGCTPPGGSELEVVIKERSGVTVGRHLPPFAGVGMPSRSGATHVIVPGAGVRGRRPTAVLADRLECAIELYEEDRSRRILVSGDHGRARYDEVNAMRRYLLARGVADRDVFMDHAGFRTLDTMERAAQVFGVRRAIVCTQALHGPRALLLARRAGIDASLEVADRRDYAGARGRVVREVLAVGLAAIDTAIGTEAEVLGPPIPIDGDARATRDRP